MSRDRVACPTRNPRLRITRCSLPGWRTSRLSASKMAHCRSILFHHEKIFIIVNKYFFILKTETLRQIRCSPLGGRGPGRRRLSGDFSAQHVGQLRRALSAQGLHSKDRVQHGAAGIGWQSVDRRSASGIRLLDHDRRHAAPNGFILRSRSSFAPDSGIQRHPVWNDGRTNHYDGYSLQRDPGVSTQPIESGPLDRACFLRLY